MAIALLFAAAAATGVALVTLVIAFAAGGSPRVGVERGLATIDRTYAPDTAAADDEAFSDRVIAPFVRWVGHLVGALTPTAAVARIERHLDHAGNPERWSVSRVLQAKGAGAVTVGFLGVAVGALYGGAGLTLFCGVAGAVAGFLVPDLLVYNLGARRQLEIRKVLPDTLDMLTICVEAGLGFDAALGQVAQNSKGPMAGESARVLHEMRIGLPRSEAMRAMADRTTLPELRAFASAIVQATDLGIPIASVLRQQAKEMRLRRRQFAEERAQKVPIKILFPMLFCMFPSLFVVVIGPGVIKLTGVFSA